MYVRTYVRLTPNIASTYIKVVFAAASDENPKRNIREQAANNKNGTIILIQICHA